MKAISTSRLRDNLLKALAISAVAAVPGAAFVPAAFAAPSNDVQTPPSDCKLDMTGDGTAASPFLISNEVALAEINDCILYHQYFYYKLTKDIVLKPGYYDWDSESNGWTPIGWIDYYDDNDYPFTGVFDGNGHTISGLYLESGDENFWGDSEQFTEGLFGMTMNAVIKNLTVEGNVDTNDYAGVGGLIGWAASSDNAYYYGEYYGGNYEDIPNGLGTAISNITVNLGTLNADSDATSVGGVVGEADNLSATNVKANIGQFGLDQPNWGIGGIVGEADNSTLSRVTVNASIDGGSYDTGASDVGGIVGNAQNTSVSKATFTGNVQGWSLVGGIAGYFADGSINDVTVTAGSTVSADTYYDDGDAYDIGGIAGNVYTTAINNATFAGTLSAVRGEGEDIDTVGGLVGYLDGNDQNASISNSKVTSAASITVNGDSSSTSVGGAVGLIDEDATLSNVENHANVSVTDVENVGGLVGSMTGNGQSTIDHSLNTGNVTGTSVQDSGVFAYGGLVGWANDGVSITNSGNQGDVSATGTYADPNDIGGIVGYAYDSVTASYTYNTGDLTGDNQVGGIIGYADDEAVTVNNSYSAGAITALTTFSEETDGIANGYFGDPSAGNTVLGGTGIRNRTGANVLTAAQLKTASVLTAAGWDVAASGDWNLDGNSNPYNGGFPFLAWEYTPAAVPSSTPSSTPSASSGSHTYTAVAFGKTSSTLTTGAKNYLASVAEDIKAQGYTTITLDGYASRKTSSKVTARRTNNVKKYLQANGITATFTTHQNLLDGVHIANTVVITAAG